MRAEGLLAPSSARFSVDKRCRLCMHGARALDRCSATHCQWQHCASTQLKALRRPADQLSDDLQSYHMYWHWIYAYTWRATERRLHFDSPTRTRVNSDSSVNDGYCFRLFSVDTSPSTYFSPFPSRTLPRSTRTMTDSDQLRSSISLLGNHAEFLLSRSTSALNTLQASHAL